MKTLESKYGLTIRLDPVELDLDSLDFKENKIDITKFPKDLIVKNENHELTIEIPENTRLDESVVIEFNLKGNNKRKIILNAKDSSESKFILKTSSDNEIVDFTAGIS